MRVNLADIDFTGIPTTDRLLIAQALLDSVLADAHAEPLMPEQTAEMNRRLTDIEAGRVTCVPWDEARDRLWSQV